MKKLVMIALVLLCSPLNAAQVDPDTYKSASTPPVYGRSDGWFMDSSYNIYYMVNGSSVYSVSSTGTISYTSLDLTAGGLTLENDAVLGNAVDGAVTLLEGGENLTLTFGTNEIAVTSTTGVTSIDFGTLVLEEKRASPVVFDTFGEGASKGIFTLQSDGTAFDGTAGVLNLIHTSWGNKYAYFPIVGQTAEVVMSATGMNIASDQTDNDGVEIYGGVMGASGRPFVIGTDPAFQFCATITIADASGTDDMHVGFRGMQAATAGVDDYTDVAAFGIITNANPAAIYVTTADDNGGMTETDTTDTWVDGASKKLCVLVSAAGVVTYTNAGAAPTTTAAFTWDDGDLVVPFVQIIQHGDFTEAVDITEWDVSYQ